MSSKLELIIPNTLRHSVVSLVWFDQRQNLLLQFTAHKLDVARFSLVVDYPSIVQFWEMGMVKDDAGALSMFVGYSLRVIVPNPVCNALHERIVFQCLIRRSG